MKDLMFFLAGAAAYCFAAEGMDRAHIKLWSLEFWMIFLGIGLGWTFIDIAL